MALESQKPKKRRAGKAPREQNKYFRDYVSLYTWDSAWEELKFILSKLKKRDEVEWPGEDKLTIQIFLNAIFAHVIRMERENGIESVEWMIKREMGDLWTLVQRELARCEATKTILDSQSPEPDQSKASSPEDHQNPIQQLEQRLKERFPEIPLKLEQDYQDSDLWFLEICWDHPAEFTVIWSKHYDFDVTVAKGFRDDGPIDENYPDVDAAFERVVGIIEPKAEVKA